MDLGEGAFIWATPEVAAAQLTKDGYRGVTAVIIEDGIEAGEIFCQETAVGVRLVAVQVLRRWLEGKGVKRDVRLDQR